MDKPTSGYLIDVQHFKTTRAPSQVFSQFIDPWPELRPALWTWKTILHPHRKPATTESLLHF